MHAPTTLVCKYRNNPEHRPPSRRPLLLRAPASSAKRFPAWPCRTSVETYAPICSPRSLCGVIAAVNRVQQQEATHAVQVSLAVCRCGQHADLQPDVDHMRRGQQETAGGASGKPDNHLSSLAWLKLQTESSARGDGGARKQVGDITGSAADGSQSQASYTRSMILPPL